MINSSQQPLIEPLLNIRSPWINGAPEFFQVSAPGAFDLAVEMRRARLGRAELDGPVHEPALDRLGKELQATVSLDALEAKGISSTTRSRKASVFLALRRG
jgi:hypothetical protein